MLLLKTATGLALFRKGGQEGNARQGQGPSLDKNYSSKVRLLCVAVLCGRREPLGSRSAPHIAPVEALAGLCLAFPRVRHHLGRVARILTLWIQSRNPLQYFSQVGCIDKPALFVQEATKALQIATASVLRHVDGM